MTESTHLPVGWPIREGIIPSRKGKSTADSRKRRSHYDDKLSESKPPISGRITADGTPFRMTVAPSPVRGRCGFQPPSQFGGSPALWKMRIRKPNGTAVTTLIADILFSTLRRQRRLPRPSRPLGTPSCGDTSLVLVSRREPPFNLDLRVDGTSAHRHTQPHHNLGSGRIPHPELPKYSAGNAPPPREIPALRLRWRGFAASDLHIQGKLLPDFGPGQSMARAHPRRSRSCVHLTKARPITPALSPAAALAVCGQGRSWRCCGRLLPARSRRGLT